MKLMYGCQGSSVTVRVRGRVQMLTLERAMVYTRPYFGFPKDDCVVCAHCSRTIPDKVEIWGCRQCNFDEEYDRLRVWCSDCFVEIKTQNVSEKGFSHLLPLVDDRVRRHFALDARAKYSLRSARKDDGYGLIPGDKEFMHWSQSSGGRVVAEQGNGQESDVSALQTRLLRLGANMVSAALQHCGMRLPRWGNREGTEGRWQTGMMYRSLNALVYGMTPNGNPHHPHHPTLTTPHHPTVNWTKRT